MSLRKWAVRLYILHSFFARLYFFLPIFVLWFLSHGLTQFQVTLLISVFFLSTTLSEIPTGIFSDRFGHQGAMFLSGIFQAIGVFLLAFPSHFLIAIIGQYLMGIGQAFYTGSKEALLFNYLEDNGLPHFYQRDYSRAKLFEFVGMAMGSLVGGSIYVLWNQLPFFLSAASFLLAALCALSLRFMHTKDKTDALPPTLALGIRKIRAGKIELQILIAYYCLIFTSILIFIMILVQPYLKASGLPLSYFGIAFFIFQSASMGGSLTAQKLSPEWISGKFFLLLTVCFASSLVLLAWRPLSVSLVLIVVIYFIWGLFLPTISHQTNRFIPSKIRATILSTQDFLQNLLFVILAPLLGILTDRWNLSVTLTSLSALVLLGSLLPLILIFRTTAAIRDIPSQD